MQPKTIMEFTPANRDNYFYSQFTLNQQKSRIENICGPYLPEKPTQADYILAYLKTGRTLTRKHTIHLFDIFEAPAQIVGLRRKGWPIKTQKVSFTTKLGFPGSFAIWYLDVNQCYKNGLMEAPGTQRGLF